MIERSRIGTSGIRLVEFSGIDGSGKSTVLDHIAGMLNSNGVPTFERSIRSMYKRVLADIAVDANAAHWSDLYSPQSVEVAHALEMLQATYSTVVPFCTGTQVVLTDTYIARWIATAAMWGADDLEALAAIYRRFPKPCASVHLEVGADVAFARITARPKRDHATKLGNSARLRRYEECFAETKHLVEYERHAIDATLGIDSVVASAYSIVLQAIGRNEP